MTENVRLSEFSSRALSPFGVSDPFEVFADAVQPRTIVGALMKFSKGDFLAGEDGHEIAEGTAFTANLDELMAGWVRWSGGKPIQHLMVRVAEGCTLPKRTELGDDDATRWETDSAGTPRDPWQFTNYLPLLNEAGLFTFTTSSRGGLSAIGSLCRLYSRHRRKHPDVHPVIALEVGSYQHANKEFGRIKFPKFKLIGWAPKSKFDEALAAAGFALGAEPPASQEETQAVEMSDEIPF
jgi:hypothetical protein